MEQKKNKKKEKKKSQIFYFDIFYVDLDRILVHHQNSTGVSSPFSLALHSLNNFLMKMSLITNQQDSQPHDIFTNHHHTTHVCINFHNFYNLMVRKVESFPLKPQQDCKRNFLISHFIQLKL